MVRNTMVKSPSDDRLGTRMMTTEEVSQLLNVHVHTVRQWSHRGLLKAYRLGPRGDRRFTEKDVLEFILNSTSRADSSGIGDVD